MCVAPGPCDKWLPYEERGGGYPSNKRAVVESPRLIKHCCCAFAPTVTFRDICACALRCLIFPTLGHEQFCCVFSVPEKLHRNRHSSYDPSLTIDAKEGRDIATVDVPGAIMQTKMDEIVHVRLQWRKFWSSWTQSCIANTSSMRKANPSERKIFSQRCSSFSPQPRKHGR